MAEIDSVLHDINLIGLVYDQAKKGPDSSYQAGYQAGSRCQPPNPPR